MALLGPSGSGKTTLLRIIAGLEEANKGEVYFGDENASSMPVQDRRVGFVFQNYALFKHMTVAENIGFGLTVRSRATRPSKTEIRRRVLELLDLVQLSGLDKRRPAQLSGGQRQRVALARALAVEPRVLLLDEPFGALDAQVRRDLRRWLRELHDRTGHTTIFVTHDQDEALELADRVAVLNKGRIEQIGTPDDIYDRPATAFVHDFIGEASSFPVRVEAGSYWIGTDRLDLPVDLAASGAGRLFIRPQDVQVDPQGGIPAEIVAVRRSGATRRAEITFAALDGQRFEINAPADHDYRPGDMLPVRFTKARFFPASP
jgi:sulfate transport system ATP-binding protein